MKWRIGARVRLNVYDGDRPVCQCHNEEDAARIVDALNSSNSASTQRLVFLGELDLSVRATNCACSFVGGLSGNITTQDILQKGEWHRCRNMGSVTYAEIATEICRVVGIGALRASPFWNTTFRSMRGRAMKRLSLEW